MSLDKQIRKARQARGLSQQKIADRFHISRSAVAQWESPNGTRPDHDKLAALAEILNVSLDSLLETERSPAPSFSRSSRALPRLTPDQLMLAEAYPTLPEEKKNEWLERMAADPDRYKSLLDALLTEVSYSTVRTGGGTIIRSGSDRRKKNREG